MTIGAYSTVTGCIDLKCGGFLQVRTMHLLHMVEEKRSVDKNTFKVMAHKNDSSTCAMYALSQNEYI